MGIGINYYYTKTCSWNWVDIRLKLACQLHQRFRNKYYQTILNSNILRNKYLQTTCIRSLYYNTNIFYNNTSFLVQFLIPYGNYYYLFFVSTITFFTFFFKWPAEKRLTKGVHDPKEINILSYYHKYYYVTSDYEGYNLWSHSQ